MVERMVERMVDWMAVCSVDWMVDRLDAKKAGMMVTTMDNMMAES
jgi:hypothetical protein